MVCSIAFFSGDRRRFQRELRAAEKRCNGLSTHFDAAFRVSRRFYISGAQGVGRSRYRQSQANGLGTREPGPAKPDVPPQKSDNFFELD